jgi:uncharacterized protein YggL (DUF469 family)
MNRQRRNSAASNRLRRMNRRQRKKYRLGEFRELGFELGWQFRNIEDDVAVDAFIDAFLSFVEARDIGFGGGFRPDGGDGFACRLNRGSVTEDDRTALVAWLKHHPAVASAQAGEFRDAWHGWSDDFMVDDHQQLALQMSVGLNSIHEPH